MKKINKYYLIISILILTGAIFLNFSTIENSKARIIEEKQSIDFSKLEDTNNETEITFEEEGAIADEENIIEENIDTSNSYNNQELAIVLITSIIIVITITNLIVTKFGTYKLSDSLSTSKRLIYYCIALVICCSSIPTITIIKSDKLILNSYETKDLSEKSLAVVEITENKKAANVKEESTEENTSVIQVSNNANYEASKLNITKLSGQTSNIDGSEYFGLNAAFLLKSATTKLTSANIVSKEDYAAAFYATGLGALADLNKVNINTFNNFSNAVVASDSSEINANNMNINTKGNNSHALKSLDEKSYINIFDSILTTTGKNSALFYSRGKIEAENIEGNSNTSLAIIEGNNSISLTNTNLTTNANGYEKDEFSSSFLLYGTTSLSSSNNYSSAKLSLIDSDITINKKSSKYKESPMFYLTNISANINITNTKLHYGSDILLKALKSNQYGDLDNNGADVTFTATDEKLTGDIIVDEYSKVRLNLNNTIYKGQINKDNLSKNVDITFDYHSSWVLTGDSYINTLTVTKKDLNNVRKYIKSNGHNVYYNSKNNEWLKNKTYKLNGGGKLIPIQQS